VLCPLCATENPDESRICAGCKVAFCRGTERAWGLAASDVAPAPPSDVARADASGGSAGAAVTGGADLDDDVRFAPGRVVLGTYAIERKLGRGGMGAVFLARDDVSGQRVAVKVLPASLARERNVRERFIQEARSLAALDHPGIVPLITFAQEGDDRYLVMKYVDGRSLEQVLREQPVLPVVDALRILRETCLALDYAHGKGVIHRDIKPANIVVDTQGRVVVVDFGIARKLEGEKRLTQTGMLMGTPQYMAPEQIEGRPIDGRCDLYATGLMLFEMLAGRVPFDGKRTFDILRAHIERPVPDVRHLRRAMAPDAEELQDEIVALVSVLLQKDPFNRLQSGAEVVAVVDGHKRLTAASSATTTVVPQPLPAPPTSSSPSPATVGVLPVPTPQATIVPQRTSETPSLALDPREESLVTLRPKPGPRLAAVVGFVGFAAVAGWLGWSRAPGDASTTAAVTVADAGHAVDPLTRAVLLSRAQLAREKGELDDARVAVDTLLELDRENVDAIVLRAEILIEGQNPDAAEATLLRLPATLSEGLARRRAAVVALLTAARQPVDKPARPRPPSRSGGASSASSTSASTSRQAPPRPSTLPELTLAATTATTRKAMRDCWADHVRSRDPGARGVVELAVRVRGDGAVVDAAIKRSAFVDPALHDCMRAAARTWRFPAFEGEDDIITYRARLGGGDVTAAPSPGGPPKPPAEVAPEPATPSPEASPAE